MLHIDSDELLYSPAPLQPFLLKLERSGPAQAWLENHEAIARDEDAASPFRDRKVFRRLGKVPFLYHAEGKSIARVDRIRGVAWSHFFHVEAQTVRPRSRDGIATPCVLHYPAPVYRRWLKKYQELGTFVDHYWSRPDWPIRQPVYLKSRDALHRAQETGQWADARAFFRSTLPSADEIQRLLEAGNAFYLDLVDWLDVPAGAAEARRQA